MAILAIGVNPLGSPLYTHLSPIQYNVVYHLPMQVDYMCPLLRMGLGYSNNPLKPTQPQYCDS